MSEMARFIPAWAGNTLGNMTFLYTTTVHPRVGGEHGFYEAKNNEQKGSSPRGRGTQGCYAQWHEERRFIPAWAGNTKVYKGKFDA